MGSCTPCPCISLSNLLESLPFCCNRTSVSRALGAADTAACVTCLAYMYVMSQPKHILLLNRLATEAERDTNLYQKTHRVGQKKRGQFVLRLVYNCRNIDKISASNLAQIKVLTLNRNLFEPALENKVAPNDNTIISDKWQQFVLLLHQLTEQNTQQQQNRYIK